MQFAIGVTVLECSFVKHSHGPLGVKISSCRLKIYRESKIEKKHKSYFFEIFLQEIEYVL
jgi:hypothetical protein